MKPNERRRAEEERKQARIREIAPELFEFVDEVASYLSSEEYDRKLTKDEQRIYNAAMKLFDKVLK